MGNVVTPVQTVTTENTALSQLATNENAVIPPVQTVTTESTSLNPPVSNEIVGSPAVATSTTRPKMHTFFTPVSAKPDLDLLEVWKKTWEDAGWEPVVLTLDDARGHPDYRSFIAALEMAEHKLKDYDRMCFLRWLAMANSGGGWMSDYDTFPLFSRAKLDGNNLPNDGQFTCYSRHVPNLVSGSEEEWSRMVQLLYYSYKLHPDVFWSDMLALLEVHDWLSGYVYQKDSISLEKVYIDELRSENGIERPFALSAKCEVLLNMRAVHFSHADCERVGFCQKDRSVASKWIEAWKEKCGAFVSSTTRR